MITRVVSGLAVSGLLVLAGATASIAAGVAAKSLPFAPPSEDKIPQNEEGEAIRFGKQLFTNTPEFAKGYAGNALSCTSCHLDAGRKQNASPMVGVYAKGTFYRTRSASVVNVEDRINECMQRSINGKPFPWDSRELRALTSYIAWLSDGIPVGKDVLVAGTGIPKITAPRKPDPERGRTRYGQSCAACHGTDGQGVGTFPPVWGPKSFNLGAGMARVSVAASFIKHNMPLGQGGTLSDEDAFDIAAYMVKQPRPDFAGKANDWPKGGKPKDARY